MTFEECTLIIFTYDKFNLCFCSIYTKRSGIEGVQSPAIIINVNIGEVEQEIIFEKKDDSSYISSDQAIGIEIINSDDFMGGRIYHYIQLAQRLQIYKEDILRQFEKAYEERLEKQQESFESGFEYDENDEEDKDGGIKVPYDPQLITVAQARFSLKEIVSMVDGEEDEEPVLDLAPAFQRDYVWDNVRKSRLIESILLNIPLPMFYLSRDKNGKLQVVDGLQRLTTIYKFFKNEFKLSKLEYLSADCEGKYFKRSDLPEDKSLRPQLVRALRRYQIDCNVIEPSTPENVKLDIFKRLNTGGKELNKQEVRHAFMKKEVREFVKALVDSEEFAKATDYGVSDKRMMAQELILRYIGFYCLTYDNFLHLEYTTKMDDFLDDVAVSLNNCRRIPYDKIKRNFIDAMDKAVIMFGNRAFRKIDVDVTGRVDDKKYPINKSLFIAFSIMLSQYPMDQIKKKGLVTEEFAQFLWEDEDFMYSISHNTNYQLKEATMGSIGAFLDSIYVGEN